MASDNYLISVFLAVVATLITIVGYSLSIDNAVVVHGVSFAVYLTRLSNQYDHNSFGKAYA